MTDPDRDNSTPDTAGNNQIIPNGNTADITGIEPTAPGSPQAVFQGCLCPVMDNHNGKGFYMGDNGPMFWMTANCPMHGVKE